MVLLGEVVIEFDHAVVAVADRGVGAEKIPRSASGKLLMVLGQKLAIRLRRNWALGNTVCGEQPQRVILISQRRLRGQPGTTDHVSLLFESKETRTSCP